MPAPDQLSTDPQNFWMAPEGFSTQPRGLSTDPSTLHPVLRGGTSAPLTPCDGVNGARTVQVVTEWRFLTVSGSADARIVAVAAAQEGRVTRAQLLAAGLSDHQVSGRVKAGMLIPRSRGVYAYGHADPTPYCREIEALLTRPVGALICAHRAAAVYGYRPMCDGVDLLVPQALGGGHREDIRVHRIISIDRAGPTFHAGLPIVSPAFALVQIAADLTRRAMEVALDEAFGVGNVNRDEVRAVVAAHPTRPGAPMLRDLLSARLVGNPTGSPGQERLLRMVRAAGLPDPEMDAQIGGGFSSDLFWREARVAVEYDSFRHHSSRTAWARDRRKDEYCRSHDIALVRVIDEHLAGDGQLRLVAKLAGMIVGRALRLAGAVPTTR